MKQEYQPLDLGKVFADNVPLYYELVTDRDAEVRTDWKQAVLINFIVGETGIDAGYKLRIFTVKRTLSHVQHEMISVPCSRRWSVIRFVKLRNAFTNC
jgi:hypothetical protein